MSNYQGYILERSAYHEIYRGLHPLSSAPALHTWQISKFKYFNPHTWRKSQSMFALNLILEYSKHTICPILKPDSFIREGSRYQIG